MAQSPLAYHVTFGTYGTRLHGDDRGTVDRRVNHYGDPIIGKCEDWQRIERTLLRFDPIELSTDQRVLAQASVPGVCEKGEWRLHITAAQADHVHVLLTTDRDAQKVRRWLKVWLGQVLTERWPLPPEATWWAKGGSVKWIWDEGYFNNVYDYVKRQRA